jgi:hypothetical protein
MNMKTKFIFPQSPKESFLTEKTNVTRAKEKWAWRQTSYGNNLLSWYLIAQGLQALPSSILDQQHLQNTNNKQLTFLSMRRLLFLSIAYVSWTSDWKEEYP